MARIPKPHAPTPTPILEIDSLPTDVLLADLPVRAPTPPTSLDLWLIDAGIYAGQTKVLSSELYAKYREWCKNQDIQASDLLHHNTWGIRMAARFRRGRSQNGYIYYISRESEPDISPVSQGAGRGNRGEGGTR